MTQPRLLKLLYLCLAIMLLSGCQSTNSREPLPNDPFYAPIMPEIPRQKVAADGAIFQADMANNLFSDVKARRVGDIITVNLQENTRATKSAGTTTSKETDVETINDFEGDSTADQSNNLTGSISVTVIQVLANQNLLVRGEKWLTLNNGDEYIRLTGVVRPVDVSPSNEIESTKIANARIQYSGTGTFNTSQREGWLSGFFSSEYWPF